MDLKAKDAQVCLSCHPHYHLTPVMVAVCVCASAQEHFAVVVSVRAEVVSNKVFRLEFSRVG